MRKIKRFISAALAVVCVLTATGCSGTRRGSSTEKAEEKLATYADYLANATLHYPTKDSNFRYTVYDNCATITEFLSSDRTVADIPGTLTVVLNGDTAKELPVVAIEEGAFEDETELRELTVGANILTIEEDAFSGCTALETVNMSNSVNEIGDGAFSGCESLKSIIIPAKVASVPTHAFSGCTQLRKVVIEADGPAADKKKTLGSYAFASCPRLTTIWIPEDISLIDNSVFNNSPQPIIFGAETSTAAEFAAKHRMDFVLSTREDFDVMARRYRPSLTLSDDRVGHFTVGDTAKCGIFDIKFNSVEYYSKLGSLTAENGFTYAVFEFEVKNTTAGDHYFEGLNLSCRSYAEDSDGFYSYHKEPVMVASDVLNARYPVGIIKGKGTVKGVVVLKVYKQFTYVTVQFNSYSQTNKSTAGVTTVPAKFRIQ